uniref:Uncharacterized protein n=1 Tax=Aegilops tauschii subsp. strangulata TaxID=200361 RepID=A0A453N4E1_AEGTS
MADGSASFYHGMTWLGLKKLKERRGRYHVVRCKTTMSSDWMVNQFASELSTEA